MGRIVEEPDRTTAAPYWDATGLTGGELGRPESLQDSGGGVLGEGRERGRGVLGQQWDQGQFGPPVALCQRTERIMGNGSFPVQRSDPPGGPSVDQAQQFGAFFCVFL